MREKSANFLQEQSQKNEALGFFYHMTLLHEIGLHDKLIKTWLMPGLATMRARAAMVEVGLMDRDKVYPNHSRTNGV